jgi:hypothetical protein
MKFPLSALAFTFAATLCLAADPEGIRRVPPPGIEIPQADRDELTKGAADLGRDLLRAQLELRDKPELLALLPDVQIFHKAVDWALRYDEIFDPKQITTARLQLKIGRERLEELRRGTPSWTRATGLVVRGYVSRIDGSVQPYGVVIPDDWKPADTRLRRTDVWLHGRNEKLSELAFIEDRMKNRGEFAPPDAIVLHPYGRFCNANKFAGEVDLFEALGEAKKHYPIDTERRVVRGFSMGGAACWHFATHHSWFWAAAAPGAGFAESKEFLKLGTPEKPLPPEWEQTLWNWYDATVYAANLTNCPTIAYAGELDPQKQAAEIMLEYADKEGVRIPFVIGPSTLHKYHIESKEKIEEFLAPLALNGRDKAAAKMHFVTYTLIYSDFKWGIVNGLEKHWERAEIDGERIGEEVLKLRTKNINSFVLNNESVGKGVKTIQLDEQTFKDAPRARLAAFIKHEGKWLFGQPAAAAFKNWPTQVKRPGVCGPIDHAFTNPFIFVRPTGEPLNSTVGNWAKSELDRAITQWRQVYRGDAKVKDDTKLFPSEISDSNLILWGDPSSNAMIKKIIDKLPIQWDAEKIVFGGETYDAKHHAPILIFPNPLAPNRYVVINSGFTFREAAALNNAQQTPKLPDWAIIDLSTPPDAYWPGKVVRAGFFDEQWRPPEKSGP